MRYASGSALENMKNIAVNLTVLICITTKKMYYSLCGIINNDRIIFSIFTIDKRSCLLN